MLTTKGPIVIDSLSARAMCPVNHPKVFLMSSRLRYMILTLPIAEEPLRVF